MYDDPAAKAIIISSDHVHFRVSTWHLKQQSNSLRGNQNLDPLHLTADARIIRRLIGLCYPNAWRGLIDDLNITDLRILLHQCNQLECHELIRKILKWLQESCGGIDRDALSVFALSVDYNMINIARTSIAHFREHSEWPLYPIPFIKWGHETPVHSKDPYRNLTSLLQLTCGRIRTSEEGNVIVIPWKEVAKTFDPVW
ncbi:hypothetical protein TREMEDRAFT_63926 [Tremella mesenterica DSM 1558]|uniref:uncharacterized protein n=1 Tax=Tremella mesenterica (strain ATCC 24925 / CBS 8224 / DSM 1558 / NBRC 9311 / NRRL Y-6157 / RJB 2259-6 / UBC 559-6) TaxID=578456 RepID=UPI0003F4A627|nr:uncharacterized protein TREMEDRAFT_63926 [Tremella mesenterica DSM 1558]EIW68040.1 hypothetical protein TREMEDRAFT_63926 [Tremella mesenterica DSM 1558]